MTNKNSVLDRAITNSKQSKHSFRSTKGRSVIWLAVELKYQEPLGRTAGSTFKCTGNPWVGLSEWTVLTDLYRGRPTGEAKQHISPSWARSQSFNPAISKFHPYSLTVDMGCYHARLFNKWTNQQLEENEINLIPAGTARWVTGLKQALTHTYLKQCFFF